MAYEVMNSAKHGKGEHAIKAKSFEELFEQAMVEKEATSKEVSSLAKIDFSLGYRYFGGAFKNLLQMGCRSRALYDLDLKTRRADYVLHVFRIWYGSWSKIKVHKAQEAQASARDGASKNNMILRIETIQKATNFLRSLIYTSGCRCFRMFVAYHAFHHHVKGQTPGSDNGRQSLAGGQTISAGERAHQARADAAEKELWFESIEKEEIQEVISNLNLFSHVVLLIVAMEDIKLVIGNNAGSTTPQSKSAEQVKIALQAFETNDSLCCLVYRLCDLAMDVLRYNKSVGPVVQFLDRNSTMSSLLNGFLVCADVVRMAHELGLTFASKPPAPGTLLGQTSISRIFKGFAHQASMFFAVGGSERRAKLMEAQVLLNVMYEELDDLLMTVSVSCWMFDYDKNKSDAARILEVASQVAHLNGVASELKTALLELKKGAPKVPSPSDKGHGSLPAHHDRVSMTVILAAIRKRERKARKRRMTRGLILSDFLVEDKESSPPPPPPPPPWRAGNDVIPSLGPFGHLEVKGVSEKLQVSRVGESGNEFRYAVTPKGLETMGKAENGRAKLDVYLAALNQSGSTSPKLQGKLSDFNEITIKKAWLGLGTDIKTFAWAYPLDGLNASNYGEIMKRLEAQDLEVDDFDYFLLNGGYVYWTDKLQANMTPSSTPKKCLAIFPGGDTFMFTSPRSLPKKWADEVKKFGAITIPELPAKYFRWLTPKDCENLLGGRTTLYSFATPKVKVDLLGGFAYLYDDPTKNNYFMLLNLPELEKKKLEKL